jgi:hypothetical protein
MARWLVVPLVLASCNPPLSDRQYCVKRQMAWEEAFPDVRPTEEQRARFIESCLSTTSADHANGRFDRSVRCFDKYISGRGNANAEYLAFEKCEGEGK